MNTLTLNPKSVEVIEGDYIHSSGWADEMASTGSTYLNLEKSWIVLKSNGFEITIDFDLCVSGWEESDSGDYYTPPYSQINIDSVDITVLSVEIDGYSVELTKELSNKLEDLIDKLI